MTDVVTKMYTHMEARPSQMRDLDPGALAPFQRALLSVDGTVTKLIEAQYMRPLHIRLLGQQPEALAAGDPWLMEPAGTLVMARRVILENLGEPYQFQAYASSKIALDRVYKGAEQELRDGEDGIGRVLNKYQTESYRELLWFGAEDTATFPEEARQALGPACLSRTYRIISGGRPVMLISERFPL